MSVSSDSTKHVSARAVALPHMDGRAPTSGIVAKNDADVTVPIGSSAATRWSGSASAVRSGKRGLDGIPPGGGNIAEVAPCSSLPMKLLSWNTRAGGGAERRPKQLAAIAVIAADIVALQELTVASVDAYRGGLAAAGLGYAIDSFELAPSRRRLVGPRKYGQMIASRWPLTALPPTEFAVPWRERVLSAVVRVPNFETVEIHNTHVPPGASNGWTKIRHLEGVFKRLAAAASVPRILLGDFNTPKAAVIRAGVRRDNPR